MLKFAKSQPDLRFPEFRLDWEELRVGNYIDEFRGRSSDNNEYQMLTSSNRGLMKQEEYYGQNRITEKDNTGFNIIPPGYITYRSRSDNRTFTFNINDLGITGVISTYYPVFSIKHGSNRFFVEYFNYHQHYLGKYSVGTSQQVLSLNELREIKLRIPERAEQQKIAAFLSAVDEKIRQLTRKKKLLLKYKNGVMQQIFSQKIRFKDDKENDFPDWEESRLGAVGQIIGGGTPETDKKEYWGGNIPWFTPTEIKSKFVDKSLRTLTELGLRKSSATLLPKGTLLLSSRATVGDVGIALNECCTNQGFQSIIVNDQNANEFIYYWLTNNRKELLRRSNGSTFLEISKSEISKIPILLPSEPEQSIIAKFLSSIDN